jgi:type VI secretion system secreted protein VgrG
MPEIVKQVLKECGVPEARIASRLAGTYPKLASCTQYGETMLSFVSRLLEAEGAFYFFEDTDAGLSLVLGDSVDAHQPSTPAKLPFIMDRGLLSPNAVVELSEMDALRPTKVTLRDLDWQKPELDLSVSHEKTGKRSREHYEYPGDYLTAAHGKARATARMGAFVADVSGVRGTSTAPGLAAGRIFELTGGPRDDLDTSWIVTEAVHEWDAARPGNHPYTSNFRAVPKSEPFRPSQTTPRPRMGGPQTAIVTGPSGQEIHTDAHGRVKLKFPWDRRAAYDEKSSPWVRVAQQAMSGAIAVPRIGWEVLVEFEHGDPDRPVVVGRLYNGTYLPPYPLPAKKTVSTLMSFSSPKGEGHNELRIDDADGAEHIHLHAQRDLALTVARERNTHVTTSRMVTIKADEAVTVKGNRTFAVKGMWEVIVAGNQSLTVEGARTKDVKKDEKITVNGDRKLTVTGSRSITTDANATINTGGKVSVSVAGTLSESADEGTSIAVGGDHKLTVGGAKTEVAKKGKSDTTDGKRSETVGGALVSVSSKDMSLLVGGKRTSTVGAAWTMTAAADMELSSGDALEIVVGAALTMTGAASIAFKVGSSKVLVGQGGVVIEANKIKVTSDGPASLLGAIVGSK